MTQTVSVVCDDPVTAENVKSTLLSSGFHTIEVEPGSGSRVWGVERGLIWSFLAGATLGGIALVVLVLSFFAPEYLLTAVVGIALGASGTRIWSELTRSDEAEPQLHAGYLDSERWDEDVTNRSAFAEEDTVLDLQRWQEPIPMLPDPSEGVAEAG
ncbi:MAG: hypothetical protein AAF211_06810 [Myxococcota bacterium]